MGLNRLRKLILNAKTWLSIKQRSQTRINIFDSFGNFVAI